MHEWGSEQRASHSQCQWQLMSVVRGRTLTSRQGLLLSRMFTRLTFLGTGAGMPSPMRNVSALALSWTDGSAWLFDAGEGTQQQFMRVCGDAGAGVARALGAEAPSGLSISRIKRIFISHMHGDHCLGLPGLVLTLANLRARSEAGAEGGGAEGAAAAGGAHGEGGAAAPAPAPEPFSEDMQYLEIVGPVGLGKFLRGALMATETGHLGFLYRVTELVAPPGDGAAAAPAAAAAPTLQASEAPPLALLPDASGLYHLGVTPQGVRITGAVLQHRVVCFGWAVTEPERAGPLDAAKAKALGALGAQLGALKAGQSVVVEGGATVTPAQCVGAPQPGRTALILGDSLDNSSAAAKPSAFLGLPQARGAAVLVHEATFCDAQEAHALPKGHSTARQAGAFAAELGAARLVLTHLSQRYSPRSHGAEAAAAIEAMEEEARDELRKHGRGDCAVRAVEDFEVVSLKR